MTDTLRSIAEGMEHKYPNHTRYRGGQLETFCGGGDCPKCRLEALLAEYEKVDLVKKWRKEITHLRRVANSPIRGNAGDQTPQTRAYNNHTAGVVDECADELETWLAVNLERIKTAAIQSAVDEEREGCAKIATIPNGCACGRGSLHEGAAYCHLSIAAAIRARAQAKEKP